MVPRCTSYIRCCPFFPCTVQSTDLPATTEGESTRGGSSQGRKAGPLTEPFLLVVLTRVQGCVFQATGTFKRWERASPAGRPIERLAGDQPKNWKASGMFFNLGGDALEVVLVRRWLLCSIGWVAGSPSHRRALRSLSRLRRFLGVLRKPRLTYFSLPTLSVPTQWFAFLSVVPILSFFFASLG